MRSTECFGAPEVPQTANRIASASVDFPLPRAPIMQVSPRGMLMLKPGRKPPLISIFSTSHICQTSTSRETERYCRHHIEHFFRLRWKHALDRIPIIVASGCLLVQGGQNRNIEDRNSVGSVSKC